MSFKRKVLVLYVYDNQHEFVETTTSLMLSKGVLIDALCVPTYRYFKNSGMHWPGIVYLAAFFINRLHFPKFDSFMYKAFGNKIIKSLITKYDLIDFQSFPSSQYELANYCKRIGKEYLIYFWGSDLLRASEDDMKRLIGPLQNSKKIRLNGKMRDKLCTFCDTESIGLESKFTGAINGITAGHKDISLFDSMTGNDVILINDKLGNEYHDKLLVAIGYNGSRAQNHAKVLNILTQLPLDVKKTIHLIIPMTYGTPDGYLNEIKELVAKSGVTYVILHDYLTNKEVCALRAITNIFIMVQDTDGFAASVRAHLYCQNVCLFGEWLEYPIRDEDVFYIKVNWDNLAKRLTDTVKHYKVYHDKSLPNKKGVYPFMSWDNYVGMMSELYK